VSNLMSVGGTQQVMLKVRFAEMQRSVSKNLSASLAVTGTNWSAAKPARGTHRQHRGEWPSDNGVPDQPPDVEGRWAFGLHAGALQIRRPARSAGIQGRRAHAGRTEPDRPVGAGGQVPCRWRIPDPGGSSGDDTITVEYKPFGVEMNFTPVWWMAI
jgi:pilus assembly protein CpaC